MAKEKGKVPRKAEMNVYLFILLLIIACAIGWFLGNWIGSLT